MAATVPADGRSFWTGTAAAIPAGWSRDDDFADRYLLGDDETYAGEANGGGAHTHTADSHFHSEGEHAHDMTGQSTTASGSITRAGSNTFVAPVTHDHTTTPSGAVDGGVTNGTVATLTNDDMTDNLRRIILYVLKPDDGNQDIPDDGVCITDETSLPTGYAKVSLDNDGTFILGKPAASGTAASQSNSSPHNHPIETHQHTFTSHEHVAAISGGVTGVVSQNAQSGSQSRRPPTHHLVSLDAATPPITNGKSETTGSALPAEPVYIDMLGIQNTSGGALTSVGVIIPFVGTKAEADLLSGWDYCDGTGVTPDLEDTFIRLTETDGDVGDTGGNNTHQHTASGQHFHNHSGTHTHTGTDSDFGDNGTLLAGFSATNLTEHAHTWTVENVNPGATGLQAITSQAAVGPPAYRTVIFIKRVAIAAAAESPALFLGYVF